MTWSPTVHQITPFLHVPDLERALELFTGAPAFKVLYRESNYAYLEFGGAGLRFLEEPGMKGWPLLTSAHSGGTVMISANTALLLIDIQQGLDDAYWGARNNPDAERHIAALLSAWRHTKRPVIHVQHMSQTPNSPLRPEQPGNAFKPEAAPQPGEPVFQKTVNSAFIGTSLESHLRDHRIDTVVVVGLTTDHCVSTTTRMAANLGFTAIVVSDATATFERTGPDGEHHSAEQMHRLALASLHGEFAAVKRTGEVLAELGAA